MAKLAAFIATLILAAQAAATPIFLGQSYNFPPVGGGSVTPTCTFAERNARTGQCSVLPTPFNAASCAIVTDPSGTSCSAPDAGGNPDILCCFDDVTDTWFNPATTGGAHTHVAQDVDGLFMTANGRLVRDTDNGNDYDATENEITRASYDAIIDIGDTTRYPTAVSALRAIHAALAPHLTVGAQTDSARYILITGSREFAHTDCQLQASSTERICFYTGPMAGLDSDGDPILSCSSLASGWLNINFENAEMYLRSDGGDGVGGAADQSVMTTLWANGAGPTCGFTSATGGDETMAGRLDGWPHFSGDLVLGRVGAAITSGWTKGRYPAPYVAGKSSATTAVLLRSAESVFNGNALVVHGGCNSDFDDIGIWDISGYRSQWGRWELGGLCGVGIMATGGGGPSFLGRGSHVANQHTNVAFGNETSFHITSNPSCLMEFGNSACIGANNPNNCCTGPGAGVCGTATTGACDGLRPVGGSNFHGVDVGGSIIEGFGNLLVTTGLAGKFDEVYFEGSFTNAANCTGPGEPHWFCTGAGAGTYLLDAFDEGNVMIGAGFNSATGRPCTKDPAGAPTCDAPEDVYPTDIFEDFVFGAHIGTHHGATVGIGPGADNPFATGNMNVDLTLDGYNLTASHEDFCTGAGAPFACCTGPGIGNTCPRILTQSGLGSIVVDVANLGGQNGQGEQGLVRFPPGYAGRPIYRRTLELGVGPMGSQTYTSNPAGQTIASGTFASDASWGVLIERSAGSANESAQSSKNPDMIKVSWKPALAGGDSDGNPVVFGNSGAGIIGPNWCWSQPGSDPCVNWSDLDDWFIWTGFDGWDMGSTILSFTSATVEACDFGEYWFGRTSAGPGVCNDGTFTELPGVATSLDGLGDVIAPTPLTGQHLSFNGANWVNAALNLAGGANYVTGELPDANVPNTLTGAIDEAKRLDFDNDGNDELVRHTSTEGNGPCLSQPCWCQDVNEDGTRETCTDLRGRRGFADNAAVGNAQPFGRDNSSAVTNPSGTQSSDWCSDYGSSRHISILDLDEDADEYFPQMCLGSVNGPILVSRRAVNPSSVDTSWNPGESEYDSGAGSWAVAGYDGILTGTTGARVFTLPVPSTAGIGACFTAGVNGATTVRIDPNGTDRILGTSANGDYIELNAAGESATLCAVSASQWLVVAFNGTYTEE